MSKNLVISTAILAATIATAACEKIPSGETNQSGSVRTEAGEQAKSQQTEPQERSDQTPNQATPAEIRQASKSAQGAPRETEQANKSTQPSPAQTQQANKFTQGALGENEQENKSPQAVPAGNEQENKSAQIEQASKSTQPAPAQTQQANNAVPGVTEQQSEPGRQQAAEAGKDRNAESNTGGQPSQQDRTTVQSDGGTPAQSTAQPNQQDHAQPNAQKNRSGPNERAGGTVNLSPERGSAASGPINLSSDEIRRLQMVLNQKGFSVGKPDGVLGPRTRNALIAFQRQQGLEAIGKIDQPTIAALGLSNGAGSTTTGQSGGGTRQ